MGTLSTSHLLNHTLIGICWRAEEELIKFPACLHSCCGFSLLFILVISGGRGEDRELKSGSNNHLFWNGEGEGLPQKSGEDTS